MTYASRFLVLGMLLTPSWVGAGGGATCQGNLAGIYPCSNIDLLAFVPRAELGAIGAVRVNDLWGWTDPATGAEYAIVGMSDGAVFVDLSDPAQPMVVGKLNTRTVASIWRDIKVFENHAFIVADGAGTHGLQVLDLLQLSGVTTTPETLDSSALYFGPGFSANGGMVLGSSHNIAINEDTGFAFVVGSNTCGGGLHMVDIRNPVAPIFAGCFSNDGYTHDTQCVVYHGPDAAHGGSEICFSCNIDTLTIVDVTSKLHPGLISRTGYAGAGFAHQAWLTEDHRHLLLTDEADEQINGHGTRIYIWDVSDLDHPVLIGSHTSALSAIDHNIYIHNGLAYLASYTSGLRILDLTNIASGQLTEVAYFDTYPANDSAQFDGAWGVYPFFDSGAVIVSSRDEGLFVLRPFPAAVGAGQTGVRGQPRFKRSRRDVVRFSGERR